MLHVIESDRIPRALEMRKGDYGQYFQLARRLKLQLAQQALDRSEKAESEKSKDASALIQWWKGRPNECERIGSHALNIPSGFGQQ